MKRVVKRTEFYVFWAIVALCLLIELRSGQFFRGNNLVDLARAFTVPAMFCIGELMVLISGGYDVSFPAIASLSAYIVCDTLLDFTGDVAILLLAGTALGLLMGAVNGFFIAKFNFPTLIVTLGTSSLFMGLMQGAFAAHEHIIPKPMETLGKARLFVGHGTVVDGRSLSSDMPVTFLYLLALLLIAWFIMNKTMLGRGIYAIGGDEAAAKRAGFNVFGTKMFIYCFCGALAGFAGVTRSAMMLTMHPTNLNGMEMTCIAACVLGGASVTGGFGTLTGAMLGIGLMTIMSNSLILIGIPTYWQRVFTGAIILIGTGVSAYQLLRSQKRVSIDVDTSSITVKESEG